MAKKDEREGKMMLELAARRVKLKGQIARVTQTLERSRAAKVALKAQLEQVDEIVESMSENDPEFKKSVETEEARLAEEALVAGNKH